MKRSFGYLGLNKKTIKFNCSSFRYVFKVGPLKTLRSQRWLTAFLLDSGALGTPKAPGHHFSLVRAHDGSQHGSDGARARSRCHLPPAPPSAVQPATRRGHGRLQLPCPHPPPLSLGQMHSGAGPRATPASAIPTDPGLSRGPALFHHCFPARAPHPAHLHVASTTERNAVLLLCSGSSLCGGRPLPFGA